MPEMTLLTRPTCEFLFMTLALLGLCQGLRAFLMAMRKGERSLPLDIVYECAVFVFLALFAMAVYMNCILAARLRWDAVASSLLWFSALPLSLGAYLCIHQHRAAMLPTLAALALALPGITTALSLQAPIIYLTVCAVFVCRTAYGLFLEIDSTRHRVSRLSVKETVDHLPEGLLFSTANGRPLIINDCMDAFLDALGISVNRLDTNRLWSDLEDGIEDGRVDGERLGERLLVRTPSGVRDGRTFLVTNESVILADSRIFGRHPRGRYTCMRAVDMTHEDQLDRKIERTNEELARTGDEIRAALGNVSTIARNEGILRMRSRVHDVIGQKLSILHRFLESGDLSDEAVARIVPLLADLTHDLESDAPRERPVDLDDLVSSFSLIGVAVVVSGEMPEDAAVAAVFVQVLREAATNAVRHGRAQRVDARFSRATVGSSDATSYEMVVIDDGIAPVGTVIERTGIFGMRRALAEMNGTLQVETQPSFRLTACIVSETRREHGH